MQLPRLDPDVTSPGENVMLAAACLQSALQRTPEGRHWDLLPAPAAQETADNATLLAEILALRPDVIGATLYLWNIERTLRLLRLIRQHLPHVRTVVGGPEVAREHPLLPGRSVDVAVVGEGEAVFPSVLAALRRGARTDWRNVAWQQDGRGVFGTRTPPTRPLRAILPPAEHPICRPDAQGMAYLETNRGCPMRCAFCCYNLRRKGWSSLPPAEIEHRIRILRQRGTREIRLVDPTFNAHPRFRAVLGAMQRANADGRIRFFVEIRADTLTDEDAAQLAAAGVVEAEVGVQSTDPAVLRTLHRPATLARVLTGLGHLQRHGIKPTIDFMYGLPGQGMADIEQSLAVLARFPDAHHQFLPTLLLPGTELRDRRRELGLRCQSRPPYRVVSTDQMSPKELAAVEALAEARLGGFDTPTRRFVGKHLPDLFQTGRTADTRHPSGTANRRTLFFRGAQLFAQRAALCDAIRAAVRHEPDILWQFVLAPAAEEPLDLLDALIATIRRLPAHWLDRLVSPPGTRRLAARRLFVQLPTGADFDRSWQEEAEALLGGVFH
jgi:hypothetical protein